MSAAARRSRVALRPVPPLNPSRSPGGASDSTHPLLLQPRRHPDRVRRDRAGPAARQGAPPGEPSRDSSADPVLGAMARQLASGRTLIRYDPRGFGLSDRDVRDCLARASPRGSRRSRSGRWARARFALIGIAGGGAVAVHYAARHPHRVSHLVLYGTFLLGRLARAHPRRRMAEAEMLLRLVEVGWGKDDPAFRQLYTSQMIPDGTAEQFRSLNELMRHAASPENVAALPPRAARRGPAHDRTATFGVRRWCCTLASDRRVPFAQGRALAAAIADSRFVPLDSRNHVLLPHEPALVQFAAELDVSCRPRSTQAPAPRDRMLTQREHQVLELVARGSATRPSASASA